MINKTQTSKQKKILPNTLAEELYLKKAKDLLEKKNLLQDNIIPIPPILFDIQFPSDDYQKLEQIALNEIEKVCFVLTAGGIGERLGYKESKLTLIPELLSQRSYLEHYIKSIKSLQDNIAVSDKKKDSVIPLVIMVSKKTKDPIKKLLQKNKNYGLNSEQITLLTQKEVPTFVGNDPRLVRDVKYPNKLLTKPNGHGNIHELLYENKITEEWILAKKEWVVFFQDTNFLFFHNILPIIGKSILEKCDLNFMTVKRKPEDSLGSIVTLVDKKKENEHKTINIEYNEINKFLSQYKKDSFIDKKGFSLFPGCINQFVANLKTYEKITTKNKGIMPEFVNPKYKDHNRTEFKSPCRIESMMQDYAKYLGKNHRIICTSINNKIIFSPVKFSIENGKKREQENLPSYCLRESEENFLKSNILWLQAHNIKISYMKNSKFQNIPKLSLHPKFFNSTTNLKKIFPYPEKITVSPHSTLIVDGENIQIDSLNLDGTLIIKTANNSKLTIKNEKTKNKGWHYKNYQDPNKIERIRDYYLEKKEEKTITVTQPGSYIYDNEELTKL